MFGLQEQETENKDFEGFVGANEKDDKSERGFHMHAYVNNVLITEHPASRLQTRNRGLLL